jgi:hypothetical protein
MSPMHDSTQSSQNGALWKLSDEHLVERLFTEGDRLERVVADEIIRRGGLSERLGRIVSDPYHWNEPQPAWWAVVHAVYILGAVHSEATVLPLFKALRYAEACENDWVAEDLPSILGAVGRPAIEGLAVMTRDATNGWYTRAIAMEGLAAVALREPDTANGVFERIRWLFRSENADRMVRQAAGQVLLDFLDQCSKEDLLAFGSANRLDASADPSYRPGFTDKDVTRKFSSGEPALDRYTRDWMTFYDSSAITARQERWEKERQEQADAPEHAPAFELCPFGVEQKRKKCCLGKTGVA